MVRSAKRRSAKGKPTKEELVLEVALAWIFARNHEFNALFEPVKPPSPIIDAFATFNSARDDKCVPVLASVEKAWDLLRAAIIQDHLELRGVPFRKAHEIGTLETFELRGSGPPKTVPRDIIGRLLLDETTGELMLRPKGWITNREHWWRHVEVAKEELFAAFPDSAETELATTAPLRKPKRMSRKYRLITLAITALWPEGNVMDATVSERDKRIIEWIHDHQENEDVSSIQIYRYFKDLNAGLIDGF